MEQPSRANQTSYVLRMINIKFCILNLHVLFFHYVLSLFLTSFSFVIVYILIYHHAQSTFIISILLYLKNYMCTNISPCESPGKIVIINNNKSYPLEIKCCIIIIIIIIKSQIQTLIVFMPISRMFCVSVLSKSNRKLT